MLLEYLIDGTAFPHIPFDIGESYGGNLPISRSGVAANTTGSSNSSTEQQLFFWFFPSENPAATDEIMIWLNGGVSTQRISEFLIAVHCSGLGMRFDCFHTLLELIQVLAY